VARVAQEEVPMPYNERLEAAVLPSEEKILQAVYQVCYL
jgi:pyruvate/2-oxoglutarate/acetoin dehydrogenase E1 component